MKKELNDKANKLGQIINELSKVEQAVEAMITDGQERTEVAPGFAYYEPEIEAKRKEAFELFQVLRLQIFALQDELIELTIEAED